jgi:allene oxide cyclase
MPTTRSPIVPGLAGAAALAVAVALPAAAGAHATAHHHARRERTAHTITVVEHAITDTEQRAVPGGPDEPGDPLTFTNPVFNTANTRQVGHDEGFCMRLNVSSGAWECLWTTFLARGQLTVQGPYYDTRSSVLSITGGTGAYRDARGQMKLVALNGGKEYDFIFHLS